MRPPPLSQRLTQTEEAAALGRRHIERQWEIITEKDKRGADTALSRALLRTYCESQKLHEQHLQRLIDESRSLRTR